MKKQILILVLVLTSFATYAQLYEIGGLVGGSNYIGDIGKTNYINPNRPAIMGLLKWNYKPQITFRGSLKYTDLKIVNLDTNRPVYITANRSRRVAEAALGLEFNFFKYNLAKPGYTHTPYIILQAGASYYGVFDDNDNVKRQFSFVAPFGAGYKMKLAENFGIALETSFTYTFKDNLDGNNHNNPNRSFGNKNSNDWYVFTGISVVYAFGRPGCYKGYFY